MMGSNIAIKGIAHSEDMVWRMERLDASGRYIWTHSMRNSVGWFVSKLWCFWSCARSALNGFRRSKLIRLYGSRLCSLFASHFRLSMPFASAFVLAPVEVDVRILLGVILYDCNFSNGIDVVDDGSWFGFACECEMISCSKSNKSQD